MDLSDTQLMDISHDGETEDESGCENNHSRKVVASLSTFTADNQQLTFPIYAGLNKIGRGPECDIQISSEVLSKQHCCIEYIQNTHMIYDLKSRNRTKRNEVFLCPGVRYEIRSGDKLKLGSLCCEYRFVEGDKENLGADAPNEERNYEGRISPLRDDVNAIEGDESDDDDDSTESHDLLMNLGNEVAAINACDLNLDGGDGNEECDPKKLGDITTDPPTPGSAKPIQTMIDKLFIDSMTDSVAMESKKELDETPDSIVPETQFDSEVTSPRKVSTHCSRRMSIAASLTHASGITEIPDTPEKDQLYCHTPVGLSTNSRSNMGVGDSFDESIMGCDVELRRKLFHDSDFKVLGRGDVNLKERVNQVVGVDGRSEPTSFPQETFVSDIPDRSSGERLNPVVGLSLEETCLGGEAEQPGDVMDGFGKDREALLAEKGDIPSALHDRTKEIDKNDFVADTVIEKRKKYRLRLCVDTLLCVHG